MTFSRTQLLFFLLFFGFFFIDVVLGETPVGILLWGVLGLVCFGFGKYWSTDKKKELLKQHSTAIFLLLLFLLTTLFSVFFTASIPLTLNKLILISVSVFVFQFFFFAKKEILPTKYVLFGFLLLGMNVAFLSLLFFFFPELAKHLPGMNLLFNTYGHNHASIIYLFCIPIAIFFDKEFHFKWFSILPLLFLFVSLIFTFARIDILIGCLEITLLWIITKNKFSGGKFRNWKFLTVLALIVILAGLVFKYTQSFKFCFSASVEKQVCKELSSEYRVEYWKQGLAGLTERPLTGWGPGTFSIISMKKATLPFYYAAYAHNEYLQLLSEYGWILSLPIFIFLAYSIITGVSGKFDKNTESLYVFLSIGALLVDGLFDFNWSYSAIWILLLISIALLLRDQQTVPLFLKRINTFFARDMFLMIYKTLLIVSFCAVEIWTIGYVLSTGLWYHGDKEASVTLFPFIYSRVEEEIISVNQPQFLLKLYENHTSVLAAYVQRENLNTQEKIQGLQQFINLAPHSYQTKIQLLNVAKDSQNGELYLSTLENIRQSYFGNAITLLTLEEKKNLFDQVIIEANFMATRDVKLAAKMYLTLIEFDSGLASTRIFNPYKNPNLYRAIELKSAIDETQSTGILENYNTPLSTWLRAQLTQEIQRDDWVAALLDFKRAVLLDSRNSWVVWDTFSSATEIQLQTADSAGNNDQTWLAVMSWYQSWQIAKQFGQVNQATEEKLAQNMAKLGNAYYQQGKIELAVRMYFQAQQVEPYFEEKVPILPAQGAETSEYFSQFVAESIKMNGNYKIPLLSKYIFKKPLQGLANQLIRQQKWSEVEDVLHVMSESLSQDFYSSGQLGNYYLMRNNTDAASKFFTQCVARFKNPEAETDCYWGKFDTDHFSTGYQERYFRVSEDLLRN